MSNYSIKKIWLLALLLVIVIFLILALALVYLNFKEGASVEPASVANPDNYQIPLGITLNGEGETGAAAEDPTSGWLEFKMPVDKNSDSQATDTAVLFSFKYPSVFAVSQRNNRLTLESDAVTSTQMHIDYQKSNLGLADYLEKLDDLSARAYEGQPSVEIVTSTDKVVVNGIPAVFREQKLLAADLSQYIVYFKAADNIYTIDLIAPQLDQTLFTLFALFVNNFKIGQ